MSETDAILLLIVATGYLLAIQKKVTAHSDQ